MTERLIQRVIEVVGQYYGADPVAILTRDRHQSLVIARHTAMYVSRLVSNFSYPQIGQAFGRDHSSVMNACKRMAHRSVKDEEFGRAVDLLVQRSRDVRGHFSGAPVRIRTELLHLLEARVKLGIFGASAEDIVDRILCEHFQRELQKKP